MLSPALRLGWLAAPDWLIRDLTRAKFAHDMGSEILGQATLARFIDAGALTRHLRRMRPIYHRRRDVTIQALTEHVPGGAATGISAGLHVLLRLPRECPEAALVAGARAEGVEVEGGARHWANRASAPQTLVLGYGPMPEQAIQRGIEHLGLAYRSFNGTA
jgi:GntR family transcriptional regulator/MocR family aminotransferase